MPKRNKRRSKRIKNLIVVCTLVAVVLSVSTYAWFVGMRPVNVSSFDVEIATTDSLLLSLDGKTWDRTVEISKATLETVSYVGHTNNWAGKGLFPMSSVGDMDTAVSRMKLYEKASLKPTPGGYRLLASRVLNYEEAALEQDGYVVFDLFIKNFTGDQYIPELVEADEEAIFLTVDSEVSVAADGVPGTGIENSVRVAFAQIGRVSGFTTNPDTITNITCSPDLEGNPEVKGENTGICRTAQIWEPNDTKHEQNAIKYYNTSCLPRTGPIVKDPASYNEEGTCGIVETGNTYATYAVNAPISSLDNVDVYDGPDYNGYTGSALLTAYPYFTDSMKLKTGTERPEFMTLAPNSITKVRIYIYIEGQDIDNYDWASIGKRISVKFGFEKQRFTESDYEYTDPYDEEGAPARPAEDTEKPVITLTGLDTVNVPLGSTYTDEGATASDEQDGDITDKIIVVSPVNTNIAGTYIITYNVSDWAGNYAAQVTRTVIVEEQS